MFCVFADPTYNNRRVRDVESSNRHSFASADMKAMSNLCGEMLRAEVAKAYHLQRVAVRNLMQLPSQEVETQAETSRSDFECGSEEKKTTGTQVFELESIPIQYPRAIRTQNHSLQPTLNSILMLLKKP